MSETDSLVARLIAADPIVPFWPDAGTYLNYTRPSAYAAKKAGTFDVAILQRGQRNFCRRADLLKFLGIADPYAAAQESLERAG
jgi:hypothetical protein